MSVQLISTLKSIEPTTNFERMKDFPSVTANVARVLLGFKSTHWDIPKSDPSDIVDIYKVKCLDLGKRLRDFDQLMSHKISYKTKEEIKEFALWAKKVTAVSLVAFAVFYHLAPLSLDARVIAGLCAAAVLALLNLEPDRYESLRNQYVDMAQGLKKDSAIWHGLVQDKAQFAEYARTYAEQPFSPIEELRINRQVTKKGIEAQQATADLKKEKSEDAKEASTFVDQLDAIYQ